MTPGGDLLTALQFADGMFPAGGFAVSNGLERLAEGRRLPAADLDRFFERELNGRFGPFDRVAAALAHGAAGDLDALSRLDGRVERMSWASVQRDASVRSGRGLLTAAARIGLTGLDAASGGVRAGVLRIHQQVALGVVLNRAGLDRETALLVAGHRFLAGLTGAAVRLGQIGAIGAQQVLTRHRPDIARWAAEPVPDDAPLTTFHPEADIAMLRHRDAASRLFAA